jgi:hypothetical protein
MESEKRNDGITQFYSNLKIIYYNIFMDIYINGGYNMKLEEIENLNKYLESRGNFYLDQDTSSKDKIKIFFSLNEDIDENEYQVKINDIENKYRSKGYSIDTVDIYILPLIVQT